MKVIIETKNWVDVRMTPTEYSAFLQLIFIREDSKANLTVTKEYPTMGAK